VSRFLTHADVKVNPIYMVGIGDYFTASHSLATHSNGHARFEEEIGSPHFDRGVLLATVCHVASVVSKVLIRADPICQSEKRSAG